MGNSPSFRVEKEQFVLDGEEFQQLSFLDICAGTSERLQYWRKQAISDGRALDQVNASLAIDISPKDDRVHQADVLCLLRSIPSNSVAEVNGDYFYASRNSEREDSDGSSHGLGIIVGEVKRVLVLEGKFWATLPLALDKDIRNAAVEHSMNIQPIQFGYTGFLGGQNDRFPVDGLPAVEPVTQHIKHMLEATRKTEEEDPMAWLFTDIIGKYGYVSGNPVRYLITNSEAS